MNGNQSFATPTHSVLSSLCIDCHFHFVFKMSWEEQLAESTCSPNQSIWPMKENRCPWHHLVWAGSDPDHSVAQQTSKYLPLLSREHFVCTAPPCTFQLSLEVSEPRMGKWWTDLLSDSEAIREALREAREQDPERYEAATDAWAYSAPLNLNTYLKDQLETPTESLRSISKRNKRFAVLFGPRCFEIFRALGFEETKNEVNGVDEGSFKPVSPEAPTGPSGTTELNTYRAYIEDVRSEVQCIIHRAGQALGPERPSFITGALHTELRCSPVPDVESNALVNLDRYKLLGVLPGQSREVVVNAYFRQWEILPTKRRALVDALMSVANDIGDDQLSDFAMTQSSVFDSMLEQQGGGEEDALVDQALIFLGLNPAINHPVEAVISAFRAKITQSPADVSTAKNMLMLIAQASSDDTYQTMLVIEADAKLSLETSKELLKKTGNESTWQEWVASAKSKASHTTLINDYSLHACFDEKPY
jgi:ubiquitin carboxyl-terminal hydrolase 25/28